MDSVEEIEGEDQAEYRSQEAPKRGQEIREAKSEETEGHQSLEGCILLVYRYLYKQCSFLICGFTIVHWHLHG
jgi:hypothetical protein